MKSTVIILIFFSLLLSSCHRNLIDPFIPKDINQKTQFKFSKTRNRTVEKHSGFARSKGVFKDSFGSAKRGHSGRGSFGGGSDSYSSRHKKVSGLFKYSKARNTVVSKKKFLVFALHKRNGESGTFSKKPFRARGSFNGIKNLKSARSFNVQVNNHYGAFGYNKGRKRVTAKVSLFRHKDIGEGSFGHGKRNSENRQYYFDKRSHMVKKRQGFWWDIKQSFKRKKYKKRTLQLELFDPEMKRKMKLGA